MKNGKLINLKFLWPGIAALALVLMLTACPSLTGDDDKGADKTALNSAITDAEVAKTGIAASADGAGLAVGALWVTPAELDFFNAAISAASGVKNSGSADQAQVDAATATLKAAITAFDSVKKTKGAPNTSSLTSKITGAQIARDSVFVAASADSVAIDESWATAAQVADLNTAIAAAQTALTAIDQSVVDAALSDLNTALNAFNSAVAANGPGAKTSGFTQEEFDKLKARAAAALAGATVADNGDGVPPSGKWVTLAVKDALDSAITAAAALSDAAYLALSGALKTFNDAQQPGSVPDTQALQIALKSADDAKAEVVIAANSAGAALGSAWVTQAQLDALNTAYNTAKGAATKNAVDQAVIDLNDAITVFNNAKAVNGLGTKEETAGSITISGIGAVYKDGASVQVALLNNTNTENVSNGTGTVTNGALTVSMGSWDGSYYIAFTTDQRVIFISKEKAVVSSGTASIAFNNFEYYIWSRKLDGDGVDWTSIKTLDAFLLEVTKNNSTGPVDYDDWKEMASEQWRGDEYASSYALDVAFYKDPACTQAFSGSDTVGPDTVVYTKYSLGGNNVEGDRDDVDPVDPVDTVGHITGTISFTGYTGQRPQVRINAEYFGESSGGYWVDDRGSRYTVNSDGSFSIPFTQQFLTALNAGTLDLRFYMDIGSGMIQYRKMIEPMIQVTAGQLSNGKLNVGSQGPVSLAYITLSGNINITLNGQPVPRVSITASGGGNDGNITLTSPGTNAAWSIYLPVFDSPTDLTFSITGFDSEWNRLFQKYGAAAVSGVHNTDRTGVAINLGNISTITLNGTVNIDGQNPVQVNIYAYKKNMDGSYSTIGYDSIEDYGTKAHTWSMSIETPSAGDDVYFSISWRNSSGGWWFGSGFLPDPITMPYSGSIDLTYHGSGN